MKKRFFRRLPVLALALVMLQSCGSKAINEPGVDIQQPSVSFTSPAFGDSVGTADVTIMLLATDNDKVERIEIYLNSSTAPIRVLNAAPWETAIPASEIPDGSHELLARAFDPTGNASIPARVSIRKGQIVIEEVQRMTLAELVTSANCAPCGLQNETWQHATDSPQFGARTATIRYHVWWPRTTDLLWQQSSEWSRPRTLYLFSPMPENEFAAPKGWVGGQMIGPRGTDWIAAANTDMAKQAGAKIELTPTRDASAVSVTITVKGISTSSHNDLRLHTVLTEGDIEYNDGNSEFIHFNVMRRMYPDAQGEQVSIANGQTVTFQRVMPIESHWNPENLDVVVFLQAAGSKEILQAAKAKL
jgi:hypothetical protein